MAILRVGLWPHIIKWAEDWVRESKVNHVGSAIHEIKSKTAVNGRIKPSALAGPGIATGQFIRSRHCELIESHFLID